MNWVLIAVIIALAGFGILGYVKGFVAIAVSLVSTLVVIILTSIFAPKVATMIREKTEWDENLQVKVQEYLDENGVLADGSANYDIDELPLPKPLKESVEKQLKDGTEAIAETYNKAVVVTLTKVLFTIIVYVAMFVLISLAVVALGILLKIAAKLPVIKQINKLVGLLIGLIEGLLVVWIIFAIAAMMSTSPFGIKVFEDIHRNGFLSFLQDHNIILSFVLIFIK